jgi:hypothetical protein
MIVNFSPKILGVLAAVFAILPAIAQCQEADTRLHSDGKGRRADQAKVVDKTRPRVLLIGDSILNGYLGRVTTDLILKNLHASLNKD